MKMDPPVPQLLGLSPMNRARLILFAGALGLAIFTVMGLGMGLAYLLGEFD